MSIEVEAAKEKLKGALKHFRFAVEMARKHGTPMFAIIAKFPDGGGKVLTNFDCVEFFADLDIVLDARPDTPEEISEASAAAFVSKHGLKCADE